MPETSNVRGASSSAGSEKTCAFLKASAGSGSSVRGSSAPHVHEHGSQEHGHTHEILDSPGLFTARDQQLPSRDFSKRAFTVGVGGPVGSGKTALLLKLCKHLQDKYSMVCVTNDIFTKEDGEFLIRNQALPTERIQMVQTGGCPHAAIREDVTSNRIAVEELTEKFKPQLCVLESGGDNLAANFSRELADYIIYVIDVAGGDKVPRKGGPGITQSDLLIINKTDLAEAVGSDLGVMKRDAALMRQSGPTLFTQCKHDVNIDKVCEHIVESMKSMGVFQ
eukprot:Nk52_evm13s598 gene=Nk52_evmTU13s598